MNLVIAYKNGTSDSYSEKQLDCSRLTIKGHASALVDALKTHTGFYKIDPYHAVSLDEIISVRVS